MTGTPHISSPQTQSARPGPFERFFLRLHWLVGLTIGVVLAIMGTTGALLSFEDEILTTLTPRLNAHKNSPQPLPLSALLNAVAKQRPGLSVSFLQMSSLSDRPILVGLIPPDHKGGRAERALADPYSGDVLGAPVGIDFFETVRNLHRYLALPGGERGIGRSITGIAAICLLFLTLSGLWLRMRRRHNSWRAWLIPDFRARKRSLHKSLHLVIGTWLMPLYIFSVLTGLWWSYDGYRDAVTALVAGAPPKAESRKSEIVKKAAPLSGKALDLAFSVALTRFGQPYERAIVTLPRTGQQLRVRLLPKVAPHDRAFDEIRVDLETGRVMREQRYFDLKPSDWLSTNMEPLHTGSFLGLPMRLLLLLSSAALPGFAVTGIILYLYRLRGKPAHNNQAFKQHRERN